MNIYSDRLPESKLQPHPATDSSAQKKSNNATFQFADNRPEALVQREQQDLADKSFQAKKSAEIQRMADTHLPHSPIQKKENHTGLPDKLKTGIENLSGYSMDDVKVHYNSSNPAQLQAHAYAQGTAIHVAPGQEKHLPHEAWHVVQQKQGRVKPTLQMKGKINVNDDAALEKEADVMGEKALQFKATDKREASLTTSEHTAQTVQRVEKEEFLKYKYLMKDYIPEFGMGRFDITLRPKKGIAEIVVRMHVDFSDEKIGTGLGPWTEEEKSNWKLEANESVKKVWNNITEFTITNGEWPPIKIQPKFSVSFVDSVEESHVRTTAVKVPQPSAKFGMWDGGRNGLMQDQFTDGPMTPTRALLSQIAPKFRKDTPSDQEHHNIFAHEYGHMIGLSDEYDNETNTKTGPGHRQQGNVDLMKKYGVKMPEWGKHTLSLMSDGTQLLARHFLTVKDALEKLTMSQLPEAKVAMTIREGNPVWMELSKEKMRLNEAIKSISHSKLGMVPYQIHDSLMRELEYEEAQIRMADGDIEKLLQVLMNLHAQRKEYYETFIEKKKEELIDPPVEGVDTTLFEQFIQNFLTIPWNL